jgi:hypothetical protein
MAAWSCRSTAGGPGSDAGPAGRRTTASERADSRHRAGGAPDNQTDSDWLLGRGARSGSARRRHHAQGGRSGARPGEQAARSQRQAGLPPARSGATPDGFTPGDQPPLARARRPRRPRRATSARRQRCLPASVADRLREVTRRRPARVRRPQRAPGRRRCTSSPSRSARRAGKARAGAWRGCARPSPRQGAPARCRSH